MAVTTRSRSTGADGTRTTNNNDTTSHNNRNNFVHGDTNVVASIDLDERNENGNNTSNDNEGIILQIIILPTILPMSLLLLPLGQFPREIMVPILRIKTQSPREIMVAIFLCITTPTYVHNAAVQMTMMVLKQSLHYQFVVYPTHRAWLLMQLNCSSVNNASSPVTPGCSLLSVPQIIVNSSLCQTWNGY